MDIKPSNGRVFLGILPKVNLSRGKAMVEL